METVTVLGAGLAGCEAAWQLASRGIGVRLIEMKPKKMSLAHVSGDFAELVCSNSLRADALSNAVGLLKAEMRLLNSLIIGCADEVRVEAGGALAVDRTAFSKLVTNRIRRHPLIEILEDEACDIPEGYVIIATGPLTDGELAVSIAKITCGGGDTDASEFLHFYDASAPIVSAESIDMTRAFFASRYDKGTPDYINCPMDEGEYRAFHSELCSARGAKVHSFEDEKVFEGCMPVEVMARRGYDTLRFGPMKPKGIYHPETGRESFAVCQLRRDNSDGTMYNIVGFQTHLAFPEQRRVFGMIPALENAEFLRYGVMHRNTYIRSPGLLDRYYRLKRDPRIRFAGQITGVEGYVESAASGLTVGLETASELLGERQADFPKITAIGALSLYISDESVRDFQPMNINFGIIEPLGYRVKGKQNKNLAISERSLEYIRREK